MRPAPFRRLLAWAAVGLLALAACLLVLIHWLPSHSTSVHRLSASRAAQRTAERMNVSLPQGSIDPNTASADVLEELPGVGPAIARRIVDERLQNGPFAYPEDLLTISGIGEKTLEKLRDQLLFP